MEMGDRSIREKLIKISGSESTASACSSVESVEGIHHHDLPVPKILVMDKHRDALGFKPTYSPEYLALLARASPLSPTSPRSPISPLSQAHLRPESSNTTLNVNHDTPPKYHHANLSVYTSTSTSKYGTSISSLSFKTNSSTSTLPLVSKTSLVPDVTMPVPQPQQEQEQEEADVNTNGHEQVPDLRESRARMPGSFPEPTQNTCPCSGHTQDESRSQGQEQELTLTERLLAANANTSQARGSQGTILLGTPDRAPSSLPRIRVHMGLPPMPMAVSMPVPVSSSAAQEGASRTSGTASGRAWSATLSEILVRAQTRAESSQTRVESSQAEVQGESRREEEDGHEHEL